MKPVMVVVDFSGHTEPLLAYGHGIAESLGTGLVLLQVSAVRRTRERLMHRARARAPWPRTRGGSLRLERLRRIMARSGIATRAVGRSGNLATEVLAAARRLSVECIVMGVPSSADRHGRVATAATHVLRLARCAVLLVRE